jgi:hypothetical protein
MILGNAIIAMGRWGDGERKSKNFRLSWGYCDQKKLSIIVGWVRRH